MQRDVIRRLQARLRKRRPVPAYKKRRADKSWQHEIEQKFQLWRRQRLFWVTDATPGADL